MRRVNDTRRGAFEDSAGISFGVPAGARVSADALGACLAAQPQATPIRHSHRGGVNACRRRGRREVDLLRLGLRRLFQAKSARSAKTARRGALGSAAAARRPSSSSLGYRAGTQAAELAKRRAARALKRHPVGQHSALPGDRAL